MCVGLVGFLCAAVQRKFVLLLVRRWLYVKRSLLYISMMTNENNLNPIVW